MMRALHGKQVLNTRALHQASELDRLLVQRGAVPLSFPCIAIELPEDTGSLDQALRDLTQGRFTWLAITSANTVRAVATRLKTIGLGRTIPVGVSIAVVGPATARAVREAFGRSAEIMPERHDGAALGTAIPVEPGERVLTPGSDIARTALIGILKEKGAVVTSVVAYRTVVGSGGVDLPALLQAGTLDAISFASSSAVVGCFERMSRSGVDQTALVGISIVCIGSATAETANRFGLHPHQAVTQTLEGMLDTLEWVFVPVGSGGTVWS